MSRMFGPKSADHPSIGKPCKLCGIPFKEGDYTGLISTVPADEEEAKKAKEGRYYIAEAEEVHWEHIQSIRDEALAETFEAK